MTHDSHNDDRVVAELTTLHEISSLGGIQTFSEFVQDVVEKALRLFAVHRFGLWTGPAGNRTTLSLVGIRDEAAAGELALAAPGRVFMRELGVSGGLGLLFMERPSPMESREHRVYDIFARRIEECLLSFRRQEERETALEALIDSERRFRSLFEQSLDAIWVLQPDGSGNEVNQAWLDMFGYTRDDLQGMNAIELYANPEERDDFLRRIAETGIVRDEVRFKRKDGAIIDCERAVVALRDASGTVVRFQGIVRDITERKKAQRALSDELTRRRILLDQSRDGIVVLDAEGRAVETNRMFARMLGRTPQDVLQLHVSDWDVPTPRERLDEMIRTVDESGDHFETRHRRKDGTEYDVEISTNAAEFDGRKLIFCVCRDITERKMAEAALRESEDRYRSLFELSADAALIVTLDGRILRTNPAWHDLFGYGREDLPGMTVYDIYADPSERDRIYIPEILRHGKLVNVEIRFRRKDGTLLDCVCSVVVRRDPDGNVMYLQGFYRDVTQQKRERAELERSRNELRRLAAHLQIVREEERAAVAWELHDEVSQALAVMGLDLDTLRRSLPDDAPEPHRVTIERTQALMQSTVARLRRLYSELRPGMLDDLGLAAAIEWQAGEFSRRSGIQCRVTRLDEVRQVDTQCSLALYRAFQQALDNVVRHSGASLVEVEVACERGQVTVRVVDNGHGMTAEQAASPAALGLATIRERLRACGGSLTIESREGGGAVVLASVPLSQAGEQ